MAIPLADSTVECWTTQWDSFDGGEDAAQIEAAHDRQRAHRRNGPLGRVRWTHEPDRAERHNSKRSISPASKHSISPAISALQHGGGGHRR